MCAYNYTLGAYGKITRVYCVCFQFKHYVWLVNLPHSSSCLMFPYIQNWRYVWRSKYINISLWKSYGLTKIIIYRNNYSGKTAILFHPYLIYLPPPTVSLASVKVANVASPWRRGAADNMPLAQRNPDPALPVLNMWSWSTVAKLGLCLRWYGLPYCCNLRVVA